MTQLTLTIDPDGVDVSRLAHLTRTLRSDLLSTGLVTVDRPAVEAPDNTRAGVGVSVGELVVSGLLSASTMSALASVLIAYVKRTGARSVVVRRGEDEYRFTALSDEAQRELIERLVAHADADAGQAGR